MEALMARQKGRAFVRKKLPTDKSAFILGAKVRDYRHDGTSLSGSGAKATDGLAVERRGNRLHVHRIYEAKAGRAGVKGAGDQLNKHRQRLSERGLTIVEPSSSTKELLKGIGRVGTQKVGGTTREYIHVPKGRDDVRGTGRGPRPGFGGRHLEAWPEQ